MKNEANQPQDVQEKGPFVFHAKDGNKLYNDFRFIGYTEHAERISKAANMHDEWKKGVAHEIYILREDRPYQPLHTQIFYDGIIERLNLLLKQAEEK